MRTLLLLCTLTFLGATTAEVYVMKGHVGGEIKIQCSHFIASSNTKYFCNASCEEKDILIKSQKNMKLSVSGRFALCDEGLGLFTVTISSLQKSDSGTYWCGVERSLKDTYHKVILTVEASLPTSPPTRSSPRIWDHGTRQEMEEKETTDTATSFTTVRPMTTAHKTSTHGLLYMGAVLAAVMVLLAILLFILVKQKDKHKKDMGQKNEEVHLVMDRPSSKNPKRTSNNSTTPNHQKESRLSALNTSSPSNQMIAPCLQNTPTANSRSFPDSSFAEYSTVTSGSQDCLNYLTVNFMREPDNLHYASVIFIRESDANINDSGAYSCPTGGSVDSSQSDKDTAIYSTVNK